VKKAVLNGRTLQKPFIDHKDIMNGGKLTFYMSRKPAKR